MTITIDDRELDGEIARLAAATGQTPDELVMHAMRDKLVMSRPRVRQPMSTEDAAEMMRKIREIQEDVATLPVLDIRSADEIMGYNEHGGFD